MERLWNGEKRKCFSRQTWKKIDNDQIELVIKCVRCRRSTVWKLVTCRINYVHLMSIRSDEVGLWTRMAMIFAFRVSSGNKTKPSAHRPNRIKECHTINSTWFHWTDRNAIQIFRCWISAAPAKYVEIEISKDVFMLYIDTRPFPLFKLQNIPHIQSVSMANALSSFNALREALNMGSTCLSIHHFHALAISQHHDQMEMIWRVYPKNKLCGFDLFNWNWLLCRNVNDVSVAIGFGSHDWIWIQFANWFLQSQNSNKHSNSISFLCVCVGVRVCVGRWWWHQ